MKYPLKLIEWHDAFNGNHSWVKRSALTETILPKVVQTVGFEIQRDGAHVTLAMSVEGDDICDLFTIPLGMIVREQTFRNRLT